MGRDSRRAKNKLDCIIAVPYPRLDGVSPDRTAAVTTDYVCRCGEPSRRVDSHPAPVFLSSARRLWDLSALPGRELC